MAVVQRPAAPVRDALVSVKGPNAGKVESVAWLTWLRGIVDGIAAAPEGFELLAFEGRTSALPTTAFSTDGDLSAGVYRVSYFVHVGTPAGATSSFQVTVSWTDRRGVSQSFVGTLRNGNLTTTYETDSLTIAIDAASPITAAVAYASNPANAMSMNGYFKLERLASL